MSYFEKEDSLKLIIKWLVGALIMVFIVLILLCKALIDVAENKTVVVQVPQWLESGEYVIGATQASENVFRMWVDIWVKLIGTFSYKDIEQKYDAIMPFIDTQTAFKNKSEIMRFIDFVQKNFITQRFSTETIKVDKVAGGYYKITAFGTINRQIGDTDDQINGLRYSYTFLCYVRNGQIYIKSINSAFFGLGDSESRKQLKLNQFVHFDEVLQ